ncbi:hypothetical protein [Deinococcus yavapaiensis]|nr:hypothetical protein [Deinococcus yavapaiensis]
MNSSSGRKLLFSLALLFGVSTAAQAAAPSWGAGVKVSAWFAGSGGLSAPYDSVTGRVGIPNGAGLLYQFASNGTYVKMFQSYHSNYGCTNGFTATEWGTFESDESTLVTYPSGGEMKVVDTCAPSLNSFKPLTDLQVEQFSYAFSDSALTMKRSDGMTVTLRPVS